MAEIFNSAADQRTVCPHCNSSDLVLGSGTYNSGCGCLGLLLFGWWGLLLGLLGLAKYEMVCKNCGCRWPVGRPHQAHHGGCGSGCLIMIVFVLGLLVIAGCQASKASIAGAWQLQDSQTAQPITLTIDKDGKFYGFSGVNRYFGNLAQPLDNGCFVIKGTPGVTMMAGPDLDKEQAFLKKLTSAKKWRITRQGKLELYIPGQTLAVFSAVVPNKSNQ